MLLFLYTKRTCVTFYVIKYICSFLSNETQAQNAWVCSVEKLCILYAKGNCHKFFYLEIVILLTVCIGKGIFIHKICQLIKENGMFVVWEGVKNVGEKSEKYFVNLLK